MSAVMKNPFGESAPREQNAVAVAQQQREVAEVQGAIAIAKRFPRDQIAAMDRILQACARPTLAESALYSYARGGNDITGPSIRLAEAMAQAWGNLQFGIRELEQRNGESTVEAYAWDCETNVRQSKIFQVKHERHTKRGSVRLTDPRDVYELVANQGARRLRACILGVIPGDVTEAAVKQCEVTMTAKVDITPELIRTLVEKFAEFGVSQEMLEARLQRRLDAITPALVVGLRKIYNSMKDGMSKPHDWFDVPAPPPTHNAAIDAVNETIAKVSSKPKTKEPPAPLTYAQVREALEKAGNGDALADAATLIDRVDDEGLRDELGGIYRALAEKAGE